jgi:GDP-L-fucose synthase
MLDLTKKQIVVTGGAGFLGSYIIDKLWKRGCPNVFVPRSKRYDLRTQDGTIRLYDDYEPDVVIHCAAHAGGIGLNQEKPGELFFDNIAMGINVIHQAMLHKIEKLTILGSVCAYPKFSPTPFEEKNLWDGYPEETNAPYGIAKKALLVQAQAYRQQYGLNTIYLLPVNLYGPRDRFDLMHGHVIPVLVRRFTEAKATGAKSVTLWGTGNASREFLYVEDAAEAVILATERYNKSEPVNVGTGREIAIHDLATLVAKDIGYHGEIVYDSSRPDGQPSRCLDVTKAFTEFGFTACMDFQEGLKRTIDWYKKNG